MKKVICLLTLIVFAYVADAQVEIYGRHTDDGKVAPDLNIFVTKRISEKFDFTYFGLVEKNFSQSQVGFMCSPKSWLVTGMSVGIENSSTIYRFGVSCILHDSLNTMIFLVEKGDGSNNFWYKCMLLHQMSDVVTIGLVPGWRYQGSGIYMGYDIKKLDAVVWVVPAIDFEFKERKLMFGINIKIQ